MKLKSENISPALPFNSTWLKLWDSIDNTSDPQWFVKFLDSSRRRQLEIIKKDPSQYFSYLSIEPNMQVLDIGCGTGILLHPIAEITGAHGRVVGIDLSEFMINEARKRAGLTNLPLEFYKGNVYKIDFPDETFDRASSSTLFQHLKRPEEAILEIKRVVKPGGLIAVCDYDWETLIIESNFKQITRIITNYFCDNTPNGWIGRKLYGLFAGAGLQNIRVIPVTINLTYHDFLNPAIGFLQIIERCVEENLITSEEKELWLQDLEVRASTNRFFLSFTLFRVTGRKE